VNIVEVYTVLKNIIIGFSCLIIFIKFLGKAKWEKRMYLSGVIIVALTFIHSTMLSLEILELVSSTGFIVLLCLIIFKPLKLKYADALTYLAISYTASLMLYFVCDTVTSIIFAAISSFFTDTQHYNSMAYTVAVIQAIAAAIIYIVPFKFEIRNIKGFRGVYFFIFGMILIIYSFLRINKHDDSEYLFVVSIGLITYGLFTILKRETLQSLNDKALQHRLNEITSKFNKLMQTNDFLSNRVHTDIKYLKAFYLAAMILLQKSPDAETEIEAQGIMDDITEFRKAMQIETENYYAETTYEISGIILLDSILLYMLKQAKEKGIELDIDFQENPVNITKYLSHEQFSTIMADLLENAMKAIESSAHVNRKISCAICRDDVTDSYQIVIKDSGITFDSSVLSSISKRRMSKGPGGSGRGLWNVYKVMRSSKASLIIDELIHDLDFTKAVTLRFDDKCEYRYQLTDVKYNKT